MLNTSTKAHTCSDRIELQGFNQTRAQSAKAEGPGEKFRLCFPVRLTRLHAQQVFKHISEVYSLPTYKFRKMQWSEEKKRSGLILCLLDSFNKKMALLSLPSC